MALAIVSLTKSYASTIYISGLKRYSEIRPEYVEPVKIYASTGKINDVNNPVGFTGYTDAEISNAFNKGWITEQEFNETMAMKYPNGDGPITTGEPPAQE